VGDTEIDFRFSVLHPRTNYRHFKEGISTLKQVTGREQRDVQRYIVVVIADAVPPRFLLALRALLDFRYLAQSPVIDENKQAISILDAGARRGKKGPIGHWQIPKLEFLQSVVPNIRLNGIPSKWSADFTEHAHIPLVKDPARSSNNQGHESQICRYLDHLEKIRNFDLAIAIRGAGIQFGGTFDKGIGDDERVVEEDDYEDIAVSTTAELLPFLSTFGYIQEFQHSTTNYSTVQSSSRMVCLGSNHPYVQCEPNK